MDKTLIVGGSNVNGNIGSCEVKNVSITKNSFFTENIATNSCTGEIVLQNTYFDFMNVVMILLGGFLLWAVFIMKSK